MIDLESSQKARAVPVPSDGSSGSLSVNGTNVWPHSQDGTAGASPYQTVGMISRFPQSLCIPTKVTLPMAIRLLRTRLSAHDADI